jgi:hypothetical protein
MTAPFPYFGAKSRVAERVWERFGCPANYVEPFAGSLAVLLARPHLAGTETVNDADCFLANFWRAVSLDPDAVAHHADWPVNEADMLARHKWLIAQDVFRQRMRTEPDFYDARIAGWWVWGQCIWIGTGWCHGEAQQLPHLGNAGMGINRRLPHMGDAGRGAYILDMMRALQGRLRDVRVACGDWSRVLGDSVTTRHGLTAVFLDPPYDAALTGCEDPYSTSEAGLSSRVRAWALQRGDDPLYRIALCGYEGEHEMPGSWECVAWKTPGGYGSQGDGQGRANSHRERIWFSPHCQGATQGSLLAATA